jgi:hypothetical protein
MTRHDTQSLNWYQTLGKDQPSKDKTKELVNLRAKIIPLLIGSNTHEVVE